MKLEDFNYLFINKLHVNVRVSKKTVYENVETGEIVDRFEYQFKQAILSMSDIEDMLENVNAVANDVIVFDNPEFADDYIEDSELNYVRASIEKAFLALFKSYPYQEFKDSFVYKMSQPDEEIQYERFIFSDPREDGYSVDVAILFDNDLFSKEPFYPIRPGAVVNHYSKILY